MSLVHAWTELGETPIVEAILLYGNPERRSSLALCCSSGFAIEHMFPKPL
jgi:hypothetical protein